MLDRSLASLFVVASFATACGTPTRTGPAIRPQCVVIADVSFSGTVINGQAFGSTSTATTPARFTPFLAMGGPIGAPTPRLPDTYAMTESWLRFPIGAKVYRGQVVPSARILDGHEQDFLNRAWTLDVQDATTGWQPLGGALQSTLTIKGVGPDNAPEHMAPQFLPVGTTMPTMFVCGGRRTNDDAQQSTWLFRADPPVGGQNASGRLLPIQDLLKGDSIPLPKVNLVGVPTGGNEPDPVPKIMGPGEPVTEGWLKCVMTQTEDDVSTRVLHVLALRDKQLYHAVLSDFGPVTQGTSSFDRFRSVTPWQNIESVLGEDFGDITSFAAVAQGPALQVFAIAKKSNVYRTWHTARFPSNEWRPAHDVWKESGDAYAGNVYEYRIAAGVCPIPEATTAGDPRSEIVLAFAGGPDSRDVLTMRVVDERRLWVDGVFPSVYSNWARIPTGAMAPKLPRTFAVREVQVVARPFLPSDTP